MSSHSEHHLLDGRRNKKYFEKYHSQSILIIIERLYLMASQSSLKYNVPLDQQLVVVLDKLLQSSKVKG